MPTIDTRTILHRLPSDEIGRLLGGAIWRSTLRAVDVRELLRSSRVQFVVAEVGRPLRVIAPEDCFDIWKSEVQMHICDEPDNGCSLADFEGEYFYIASEWDDRSEIPIVLLCVHHWL